MAETMAALIAQDGAYTLETVTPAGERAYERITAIRARDPVRADLAGLIDVGAEPGDAHRLVHRHRSRLLPGRTRPPRPVGNGPRGRPRGRPSKDASRPGSTIYAALTAILRARMNAGAGPVTLLNCDNLRHNGDRSRSGLLQFIERAGDAALARWIEANTSSPNAMVDRITPRPTPDVAERVKAATGWDDGAPVMAESFIQWVIEDRFVAGRPAWEKVGVEMVASVQPYEEAKIRMLNAHAQLHRLGRHAGRHDLHPRRHARPGDPRASRTPTSPTT